MNNKKLKKITIVILIMMFLFSVILIAEGALTPEEERLNQLNKEWNVDKKTGFLTKTVSSLSLDKFDFKKIDKESIKNGGKELFTLVKPTRMPNLFHIAIGILTFSIIFQYGNPPVVDVKEKK